LLEDWLLLVDDGVPVGGLLNMGGAEDGLTEPFDAIVLLWTSAVEVWPTSTAHTGQQWQTTTY